MYCRNCGAEVNDKAVVCVKCGCAVGEAARPGYYNGSCKDWLVTLLLCLFAGCFGVHRFYVGKTGTGILMLLTGGGLGVWAFIDMIVILFGNFTDGEGKFIRLRR